VAIDASDMPAFANGQRFVRNGGAERERFFGPDASWGHPLGDRCPQGRRVYGDKIQAAVGVATELPVAWQLAAAREHESSLALPRSTRHASTASTRDVREGQGLGHRPDA
jgi:hypothetical protein